MQSYSCISWIRLFLIGVMTYIAFAFPIRYPTNILAFSYLAFLCAYFIELIMWLSPILNINFLQLQFSQVFFQCSWTWNFAISLTTLLFMANPQMIKDLNLQSNAALIEMLLMHYAPVVIHVIHLYQYPRLYKDTYFTKTLPIPILYYFFRNDVLYFWTHEITIKDLMRQNMIIIAGPAIQYLAQIVGVWLHNKFFPTERIRAKHA